MHRTVGASLACTVTGPTTIELQVAAVGPTSERLTATLDGTPVQVTELVGDHGGRLHQATVGTGHLEVRYDARVGPRTVAAIGPLEASRYLRPSRYAESDRLAAVAAAEFGQIEDPVELLPVLAAWVGMRLAYVPGSSQPTDGAVDTLLAGSGVCRDYAHLAVALLRARDVPARLVAVYAPGLSPMDFHAVAEALVDGAWRVVDATLLAPRRSLVRISTGRDASDTAFLSSWGGRLDLEQLEVTATVDGELPGDDLRELVSLD